MSYSEKLKAVWKTYTLPAKCSAILGFVILSPLILVAIPAWSVVAALVLLLEAGDLIE